jgi:hypothetical protein
VRKARLYDGVDESGTPCFAAERERITDPADRARIVGYLHGGGAVMVMPGFTEDYVEPQRGRVVPMSYLTDGTWIWSDALRYYTETYGIAPDAEFVEHMRRHDFVAPAVDTDTCLAAMEELQAGWAAHTANNQT